MGIENEDALNRALRELGFPGFVGTKDDKMALFWWKFVYTTGRNVLTPDEIEYLGGLPTEELIVLVGHEEIPTDRATLIWKLVTRTAPDWRNDVTALPRYQSVIQLPPSLVMRLAAGLIIITAKKVLLCLIFFHRIDT